MDFSPDLLCFDLVCIFYFEKANHRLSNIEKISEQACDFCVKLFGLKTIYGSPSGGGVSVLKKGVSVLNAGGNCLALSPDGPNGPSMRFHDGALYFAKMTGAPIIPVCYSSSRPWFQNRWDRYLLTKPFSIIAGTVGEPIFIDRKTKIEDFEKIRKNLEDIMIKQAYDLDKRFTDFRVEQDLTPENFKDKAVIL